MDNSIAFPPGYLIYTTIKKSLRHNAITLRFQLLHLKLEDNLRSSSLTVPHRVTVCEKTKCFDCIMCYSSQHVEFLVDVLLAFAHWYDDDAFFPLALSLSRSRNCFGF